MDYLPGLASNCDPPVSASFVARIIGVSHQHPANIFSLFLGKYLGLNSGPSGTLPLEPLR
jgi:hypothetical protein